MEKLFQLVDKNGVVLGDDFSVFHTVEEVWDWLYDHEKYYTKKEVQTFKIYEMKPLLNIDYVDYQTYINKITNPGYQKAKEMADYILVHTPWYPGPITCDPQTCRYWFRIYGAVDDPIGKVSFNYNGTPE
jgi:hypothetical protein